MAILCHIPEEWCLLKGSDVVIGAAEQLVLMGKDQESDACDGCAVLPTQHGQEGR